MDTQQQPQEPDLQLLQRFTDEQIAEEHTRRLSAQVDKLLRELEDTPPPYCWVPSSPCKSCGNGRPRTLKQNSVQP